MLTSSLVTLCHVVCNAKIQLTKLRHSAYKNICVKSKHDHTEYFLTRKIYDKYNSNLNGKDILS